MPDARQQLTEAYWAASWRLRGFADPPLSYETAQRAVWNLISGPHVPEPLREAAERTARELLVFDLPSDVEPGRA